jgi:aspartyl-tRNA(Asn)/glutamyl-tRNA(Gln) amidotransferase subunit B
MGGLAALLNKHEVDISASPVDAATLTSLLGRIKDNTISATAAKDVLEALWNAEGSVDAIIEQKGLKQISDTGVIEAMIDEIIAKNPAQVADYRSGKDKLFAFFVGQAMRASKGKANPNTVNDILKQKLEG